MILGTWGLASDAYGPVDDYRFEQVLERALERGVRAFDMAPVWHGSEPAVQKAVGKLRDDVVYITRAGARLDDGDLRQSYDLDALRKDCEASLKALDTDRIDVWLLHSPPEDLWAEREEEIRELVEKLKEEGKIRAWGAAVGSEDMARAAVDCGAEVLCLPYNIVQKELLHDLSDAISDNKVGVLARSILGYGLLSGRWGEYRRFPDYDHRHHRWDPDALRARVRQVNRLRFLVHGEVYSMVSASLRYVLENQLVSAAILGPRSLGQVQELLGYKKDGPPYLPEEDLERIASVLDPLA
ncbi:MAG: aldo/keto reductase [Myxococcota bacterium]